VQCEICGRKSESRFCELHEVAYKNLLRNYEAWKKSMKVSWTEYLTQIEVNEYTGIWVKEVVRHLLASGSTNQLDDQETDSDK
jgi:hypothetical protein